MARESGVTERARIAVLISGRGSNMVALAEAASDGRIPKAQIAIVISDQANAAGLVKAREFEAQPVLVDRQLERGHLRVD